MKNGIYCCSASKVVLTSLEAYELSWIKGRSAGALPRILSTEVVLDEFGDSYRKLNIEYQVSRGIPVETLRYKHRVGNTGFESFQINEYGDQQDEELGDFLDWFLNDSWRWCGDRREFIPYSEERISLESPIHFVMNSSLKEPSLIFHGPHTASSMSYEISEKDSFQSILQMAENCRMITNWRPSYGVNPSIFSVNMFSVLSDIEKECKSLGISCVSVEREQDLPEW